MGPVVELSSGTMPVSCGSGFAPTMFIGALSRQTIPSRLPFITAYHHLRFSMQASNESTTVSFSVSFANSDSMHLRINECHFAHLDTMLRWVWDEIDPVRLVINCGNKGERPSCI